MTWAPTSVVPVGVEHAARVEMLACYSNTGLNALIFAEALAFVPKHHLLSAIVLVACFAV